MILVLKECSLVLLPGTKSMAWAKFWKIRATIDVARVFKKKQLTLHIASMLVMSTCRTTEQ